MQLYFLPYGDLISQSSSLSSILPMESIKFPSTKSADNITPATLLLNDYPRPHLKRNSWLNLNGLWSFTITDLNPTFPRRYDRLIRVPFPVESYLSDVEERVDSNMFLWYKRNFSIRSFDLSNHPEEYRILLHFDKVDYETVAYINYQPVGERHLGGYDPFSYDITSYINANEDNTIIVCVRDPTDHWYQPRGKQMLDIADNRSIFYTPSSGIWGTVWLEPVPFVRIDRSQFKTKISSTQVHLTYRVDLYSSLMYWKYQLDDIDDGREELLQAPPENIPIKLDTRFEKEGYNLKITILKRTRETLITFTTNKTNQENEISFFLSNINLWSPEDPYLYDVRIELYKEKLFIEHVDSYLGFRQISLCLKRKRICLNNKPYFMFGVLDQGYWPDGLYRAPTDDAYKFDIEQMKKLGFNALRKHMKTETSRWYYWCDVLGMLVWQDMPAAESFLGYESNHSDKT